MTAPTLKLLQDTGISTSDNITSNFQLTVNGSATNNANYAFLVNSNGSALTGWLSYAAYLAWMGSNENAVENAQFKVQTTLTSNLAAGNVINSALVGSLSYTLDEKGAAETVSSIHLSSDTGVSATDYLTNVSSQTLTGTLNGNLAAGDLVMVSVDNGVTWKQAKALTGQNTWSLAVKLTEGNHSIQAYVADAAGNVQTSDNQAYTLATLAPTVTISQSVSGLKNVTADVITVTASAEAVSGDSIATVAIYNGATFLGYAAQNATGNWVYTASNLVDGSVNTFHAVVTDTAGNSKTTTALAALDVATQAPSAVITESKSGLTNATSDILTITATADASAATGNSITSVAVYDGGTLLGNAKASGTGTWSYTASKLADGVHSFNAVLTDKAGNSSHSGSVSVNVASHAPSLTLTQSVSGLTSSHTDTITVNAAADSVAGNSIQSVTIYDKSNSGFTGQASLQASGSWTYTASTTNGLSDGSHQFYAVANDTAGNQAQSALLPVVTVATQGPTVTANGSLGSFLNNQSGQETITGTAAAEAITGDALASVKIFESVNNASPVSLGNAVLNLKTGGWSYTVPNLLNTDGAYTFTAVATDKLGNTTSQSLPVITVATQAPTGVANLAVSGISNQTTETITVYPSVETVGANAVKSIAIWDNGLFLGNASQNSNGSGWSYTENALTDGSHSINAVITDNAGNTGYVNQSVVIATQAPTASLTESVSGLTNNPTDTFTVSASAENVAGNSIAKVGIYDNGNFIANATANGNGTWSFKDTGIADGTHNFTAQVSDVAGNTTITPAIAAVVVATQVPTATISQSVSGATTSSSDTITVAASAENVLGNGIATVAIYDNGAFVADAVSNGNGSWSYTDSSLSGGTNSFSAVVTDTAGNKVQTATLPALTIAPTLSAMSYNAASGQLTLTGTNLSTNAAFYTFRDFTVTGEQGLVYRLTGGAVQAGSSSNQVVLDLNSTDQLALAGLLNQNGIQAADASLYAVSASYGWLPSATAISGQSLSVSNVMQPNISSVSFNAATDVLTVTGSGFANLGATAGIQLNELALGNGTNSYNLGLLGATVLGTSSTAFTLQLPATLDALFTANGLSSGSNAYTLSTGNGWDAGIGAALANQSVNVSGNSIALGGFSNGSLLDTGTINPFSTVTVTNSNNYQTDSATISFPAANGVLSGAGLSAGVVNNGVVTYTLDAASAAGLQTELQNLVFTPTAHQVAAGQTVTTSFSLNVNGLSAQSGSLLSIGLEFPSSVAIGSGGNVYVATPSNNSVAEYNTAGNLVGTITAGLSTPNAVVTDKNGNLFVMNSGNNSVEEFNAAGSWLSTLTTGISNPQSMAIDNNGNLYVSNYGTGTVIEFNTAGEAIRTFYPPNSGQVATDSNGNLYIAYAYGIDEYNSAGNFVQTITTNINYNYGIAVDKNGNIYIGDTDNSTGTSGATVEEYSTASAKLINTFTTSGLGYVSALAVDNNNGYLYVSDGNNNKVDQFSLSGSFVQAFSKGVSQPNGIAINSSGNIYVANSNNTVEEFNSSATLLQTVGNSYPRGLATDTSGNLYVANNSGNVQEFNSAGSLVRNLTMGINAPTAVATDSNGNVFVENYLNIEEFNSAGAWVRTITPGNTAGEPTALAIDSNGDIYVGNYGGTYGVTEYSTTGTVIRSFDSGLNQVSNLATDSSNNVYIGNSANKTTEEYNAAGTYVRTLPAYGQLKTDANGDVFVINSTKSVTEFNAAGVLLRTLTTGITNASSVTTDNQGNIFVAAGNNTLEEFSASGSLLQTFSLWGSGIPNPTLYGYGELVTDSNGHVYFADFNANYIQKFSTALTVANSTGNTNTQLTVTATPSQQISAVNYNAASGVLAFSGTNLATLAASYQVTDFSLKGDGGGSYTLTSGSGISGVPTSTGFNIQLSTADETAINALLDKNGTVGNDGKTAYNLSAVSGWETQAAAITTQSVNVSNVSALLPIWTIQNLHPLGLALDSNTGNIYVDTSTGVIDKLNSAGNIIGSLPKGNITLENISTDAAGNVFLVGPSGYSVATTSAVEEFNVNGTVSTLATSSYAYGYWCTTVDQNGNVYVANRGGLATNSFVQEFNSAGVLIRTLTNANGISDPQSLTTDKYGDLFVGNVGNATVTEYNSSGALLHTYATGISSPHGLATDNNANVYIANTGNNTVSEFDANGNLVRTLTNGILYPDNVAVDKNGNLYVANAGSYSSPGHNINSSVEEFNASGVLVRTLLNGVSSPKTLAIDANGNLYVGNLDANNHSLEKFPAFNELTLAANGSLANPDVVYNPNYGDQLTLPDATSFDNTQISASNVTAAGGSVSTLAGWVSGALSAAGADIQQHQTAWFNFNGSTYLVEQANAQGTAFGAGDTLVQLVGTLTENNASLVAHSLTL